MKYDGLSALVLAALWVGVTAAPLAHATTLKHPVSLDYLVQRSDGIVQATVLETRTQYAKPHDLAGIYTRVRLRVEDWVKGTGPSEIEVWVHGGQLASTRTVLAGQASFARGDEAIVFFYRAAPVNWVTGMRSGKWRIAPDQEGRPQVHMPEIRLPQDIASSAHNALRSAAVAANAAPKSDAAAAPDSRPAAELMLPDAKRLLRAMASERP